MIKFIFNEKIFDDINTKEKAYWIGFLYADGYIVKQSCSFGLGLKESDKEHLENFLKFLQIQNDFNNVLHYDLKTHSYKIIIGRKHTYEALKNLGFTNTKSYDTNTKVWDNIPQDYKKDFILGIWDGDGSFGFSKSNRQLSSLISNNDNLIYKISEYINNHLGENFSKVKAKTPGDNYCRIRFSDNKAKIFGDWVYKDCVNCFLPRKYQKYQKMKIGNKSNKGFKNPITKGIYCEESKQIYVTAKECCKKEFGIENSGAINCIRACCRNEHKQTRNKHFRYLTQNEKEKIKNGEFNL